MREPSSQPLVITVAPTGMVPRQRDHISVPEQPDQIAADVRRAVERGATCVHLHARDEDGAPTYRLDTYRQVVAAVREAAPDVVISVSTSGRVHSEFRQRSEVLDLDGAAKPDLGSLTLGSMNFPSQASVNSPDMIRRLADLMRKRGIVPELFDFGMVDYARKRSASSRRCSPIAAPTPFLPSWPWRNWVSRARMPALAR